MITISCVCDNLSLSPTLRSVSLISFTYAIRYLMLQRKMEGIKEVETAAFDRLRQVSDRSQSNIVMPIAPNVRERMKREEKGEDKAASSKCVETEIADVGHFSQ